MFEKEKELYKKYGIAKPELEVWGDSLTGENYKLSELIAGVDNILDNRKINLKAIQEINPLINIKVRK
jgi:hypothetical protein